MWKEQPRDENGRFGSKGTAAGKDSGNEDSLTEQERNHCKALLLENIGAFKPSAGTLDEYNRILGSPIKTPIGFVKMGENQYKKFMAKKRGDLFFAAKHTLEDPAFVFLADNGAKAFVKAFSHKDRQKTILSAVISKDGLNVSITTHEERLEQILSKIKRTGMLYEKAPGSRDGTVRSHDSVAEPEDVFTDIPTIPQKTEKSSISRNNFNKAVLHIRDITEGNRQAKFAELAKCLDGEEPRYIADDGTRRLGSAELTLKDLSAERVNKALRTMALSLDVPTKAGKGEAFAFKAQEDLSDKWAAIFASLVREAYDFVTESLSLPQVTVMSKAYLTHKGKILYSPETGEPIKQEEWNRFVKNLEDFLNRKTQGLGKRIVLEGEALGAILDRMLKYNTLDAVKKTRLEGLKYHGKTFDWIASDIKNLKTVLGAPLTRMEAARVQTIQMSAAQRITKMTGEMKEDVKQILIDGVKKRQGARQVSQALFDRFVGLNSNYQRIAETEIQNAVGGAIVREEVHSAKEGEKVYFQRVEIVDANTCPYCRRMEGKIAVWSDVPLANERVKDQYADFAIWEGKEWTGGKHIAAVGCFHPYCRGFWTRWTPECKAADAYVAEIFKRGKKWKEAVETAKKEYKEKGIENPDDRTAGYRERIKELFAGEKGAENG